MWTRQKEKTWNVNFRADLCCTLGLLSAYCSRQIFCAYITSFLSAIKQLTQPCHVCEASVVSKFLNKRLNVGSAEIYYPAWCEAWHNARLVQMLCAEGLSIFMEHLHRDWQKVYGCQKTAIYIFGRVRAVAAKLPHMWFALICLGCLFFLSALREFGGFSCFAKWCYWNYFKIYIIIFMC